MLLLTEGLKELQDVEDYGEIPIHIKKSRMVKQSQETGNGAICIFSSSSIKKGTQKTLFKSSL